jgi:hypothetical protein
MTPTVEKHVSLAAMLAMAGAILFFLAGGLRLAVMAGVFTGRQAVIENDERITKQNLADSASSPATGSPSP